ncbi:chemotaxis protein CheW [Antarcticirhabdus aurantiaca]|uniref:Chemotaxis protein CheW n=1 Tax=Antarcticirhabdus aurantiaca TaxID=2606717 RepID=A0ACD4NSI2_9HYPH|nr:chemotaxis protein CheW [Antarcticirhabdus aurantiaca]WAJ29843.1 chemotaxis protein CheW [Jeongeuplla avenae]
MSSVQRKAAFAGQEMIAFRVGEQEFCVDILAVREIRGWTPTTAIPHAPHYVLGVINLRGTVLPVVDLSSRLGFPASVPTPRHVIVVVIAEGQTIGLLVDAVSDILSISTDMMKSAPEIAQDQTKTFITGVVAVDSRMIARIAPERMLPERLRAVS